MFDGDYPRYTINEDKWRMQSGLVFVPSSSEKEPNLGRGAHMDNGAGDLRNRVEHPMTCDHGWSS